MRTLIRISRPNKTVHKLKKTATVLTLGRSKKEKPIQEKQKLPQPTSLRLTEDNFNSDPELIDSHSKQVKVSELRYPKQTLENTKYFKLNSLTDFSDDCFGEPDGSVQILSTELFDMKFSDTALEDLINIRKFANNLDIRHRQGLYQILTLLYKIAEELRDEETKWGLFTSAPDWSKRKNKPTENNSKDALHFLIRFIYGMNSTQGNQQANKYSRALSPLFRDRTPSENIIGIIESRGGLEKMSKSSAKQRHQSTAIEGIHCGEKNTDVPLLFDAIEKKSDTEHQVTIAATIEIQHDQLENLRSLVGTHVYAQFASENDVSLRIPINVVTLTQIKTSY